MTGPNTHKPASTAEAVDLSIIVPAWNAERTLRAVLEGLLSQSCPRDRYEVLLVDNGSTDRTRAIAEEYEGVRLLTEEEEGSYAARNRALQVARGSIIAFTDADCAVDPDWLAQLAEAMRDPDTQIAIGRNDPATSCRALAVLAEYGHRKDLFIFGGPETDLYYGRTNNMAVRCAAFGEVGEFVTRSRGSDTIFVRRVVDRYGAAAVRYEPSARVRHLELRTASDHLRKYYVYGLHSHEYREPGARGPTMGESWRVFRETMSAERVSLPASAYLLVLLAAGSVCWYAGRWSSRVARPRRAR